MRTAINKNIFIIKFKLINLPLHPNQEYHQLPVLDDFRALQPMRSPVG